MINALPISNSQLANHCQDLNEYLSYIKKITCVIYYYIKMMKLYMICNIKNIHQ